jgi:hypothetical protein
VDAEIVEAELQILKTGAELRLRVAKKRAASRTGPWLIRPALPCLSLSERIAQRDFRADRQIADHDICFSPIQHFHLARLERAALNARTRGLPSCSKSARRGRYLAL